MASPHHVPAGVRTVFIVDDAAPVRRAVADLVRAAGLELVGEADSGEAALTALARLDRLPDLALVDVELGGIDGFETAGRAIARWPGLVVWLMSTRHRDDLADAVDGCGARGFVSKGELGIGELRRLAGAADEAARSQRSRS